MVGTTLRLPLSMRERALLAPDSGAFADFLCPKSGARVCFPATGLRDRKFGILFGNSRPFRRVCDCREKRLNSGFPPCDPRRSAPCEIHSEIPHGEQYPVFRASRDLFKGHAYRGSKRQPRVTPRSAKQKSATGQLQYSLRKFYHFGPLLIVFFALLTSACASNSRALAGLQDTISDVTPPWLSVTLYHPEQGLHQPTVVNLHAPNLSGAKIRVTCIANEYVTASEARKVCRNVARMLRNQGAETAVFVPRNRGRTSRVRKSSADLEIEIRSRIHRSHFDNIAAAFSCCTCALTPTRMEQAYIHSVRVRGRNGVVLSENRMQSRFVQYTGCGVAGINALLDLFFRQEHEKLGGDVAQRDFSNDFYRQIAQQTFNAKMRSDVLGLTQNARRPKYQTPEPQRADNTPAPPEKVTAPSQPSPASTSDESPAPASTPTENAPAPSTSPQKPAPADDSAPAPATEELAPPVDPDDESAGLIHSNPKPAPAYAAQSGQSSAPLPY